MARPGGRAPPKLSTANAEENLVYETVQDRLERSILAYVSWARLREPPAQQEAPSEPEEKQLLVASALPPSPRRTGAPSRPSTAPSARPNLLLRAPTDVRCALDPRRAWSDEAGGPLAISDLAAEVARAHAPSTARTLRPGSADGGGPHRPAPPRSPRPGSAPSPRSPRPGSAPPRAAPPRPPQSPRVAPPPSPRDNHRDPVPRVWTSPYAAREPHPRPPPAPPNPHAPPSAPAPSHRRAPCAPTAAAAAAPVAATAPARPDGAPMRIGQAPATSRYVPRVSRRAPDRPQSARAAGRAASPGKRPWDTKRAACGSGAEPRTMSTQLATRLAFDRSLRQRALFVRKHEWKWTDPAVWREATFERRRSPARGARPARGPSES